LTELHRGAAWRTGDLKELRDKLGAASPTKDSVVVRCLLLPFLLPLTKSFNFFFFFFFFFFF
jgi:hypothetical protein